MLNQGVFCYVNDVTFGKPLGNPRMGSGYQWSQVIRGLKLSAPALTSREGRGAGD